MARQRMIRPEIWSSRQVASLTHFQFRVYLGLISLADDEGRVTANPVILAATLFPYSGDPAMAVEVQKAIIEIEFICDGKDGSPLIGLYQIGDEAFIYHPKWHKHQYINPKNKQRNSLPKPLAV